MAGIRQVLLLTAIMLLVLPDVVVLVEPVFAALAAIGHEQRGRVTGARLGEQRDHILVDLAHRQGMLDAAVAVEDHAHVDREIAATLGQDEHVFRPRGAQYPLALIPARLHVALDRERAALLETADVMAPCVLWIDEIEMGIAGYNEGETGSNTRIFSTFLTWMQEHRSDVFVAATANRINLLPAEILRKGRFDQVFFVDLPNDEERKEILKIHLRRIGLDPAVYDHMLLGSATRGWNGAEIEQAVIQARVTGAAKGREVSQNDLLAAFGKIIPLSRTMEEQLKEIRSWARTRALPATRQSKPEM